MLNPRIMLERWSFEQLLSIPWSGTADSTSPYHVQQLIYGAHKRHQLCLLVPKEAPPAGGWPVWCYIHGGGFTTGSATAYQASLQNLQLPKLAIAIVGYRLTPEFPYPAALLDVLAACAWLQSNAPTYQLQQDHWLLGGDSAGANLALAAVLASRHARLWQQGQHWPGQPLTCKGLILLAGLLQVSNTERLAHTSPPASWLARYYLQQVGRRYRPAGQALATAPLLPELADPLCLLEQQPSLSTELPPMLIGCGTQDPLMDDSMRLMACLPLAKRQHTALHLYAGGLHGFLWLQAHKFVPEFQQHVADFRQLVGC